MKRISLGLVVCALLVVPSLAATTIEFAPGDGWSYDGAGTLSFLQNCPVTMALGTKTDPLVDAAYVQIPDFTVGGIPGAPYTLTPATGNVVTITDSTGTVTYLTGTLGLGDLAPGGSAALGYTAFRADITGITVNNSIDSDALAAIAAMSVPELDFELSLQGVSIGFANMLDGGSAGYDGFSGAMTVIPPIPAPGAILLGGMGTVLVGWLRRRKTV